MKLIRAIIQPHRLDQVREALNKKGIQGLTVFQAQGYGRQRGHTEIYRGAEYQVDFRPKVALDVVVDDAQLDAIIETIMESARTGNIGDGKLFVMPVEDAVRIRTGDRGDEAL